MSNRRYLGAYSRRRKHDHSEEDVENVFSLMAKVIENEQLSAKEKTELLDEIRKARPALEDRWIYRWIVYFLGITVILTVIGGFLMTLSTGKADIPDGLIALGSAAIGALAGLLANRSDQADDE